MAPWTITWGTPWGMALLMPSFGIALFTIIFTGAWFAGTLLYAKDKVDFEVRIRSERI